MEVWDLQEPGERDQWAWGEVEQPMRVNSAKLSVLRHFWWRQGLSGVPAVRRDLAVAIWVPEQAPSLERAVWVAPGLPHGDSDEACH